MSSAHDSPANSPAPQGDQNAYPEQRHAGAVGYGPEYGKGVSTGDKLTGYKEEVKGKILRKPDLVEHGRELRTGELKKKQQEEDFDPFGTAGGDDDSQGGGAGLQKQSSGAGSQAPDTPPETHPPAVSNTTRSTDKGAREQAAATAPEGTEKAQRQKSVGNTDKASYIG
ncbi:hypothetical protein C8Q79DRAFT_661102 [Trametes meyenii]|nr:hypothetical protein C8Q79DRAFT_661102 [Trametes meyenii]